MIRKRESLILQCLIVVLVASSLGCGVGHGDLKKMRQELHDNIGTTRTQIYERVENALDEVRQTATAIRGKLVDIQSRQDGQSALVYQLKDEVTSLLESHAKLTETVRQMDASRQETNEITGSLGGLHENRARVEAILRALEATLVTTLKSEQAELEGRVQFLDKSLKDLQQGSLMEEQQNPAPERI